MSCHHKKGPRAGDDLKYVDMIWSAIGAIVAVTLALLLVADRNSPFLLASLGGSTVFLFVLTETEAA